MESHISRGVALDQPYYNLQPLQRLRRCDADVDATDGVERSADAVVGLVAVAAEELKENFVDVVVVVVAAAVVEIAIEIRPFVWHLVALNQSYIPLKLGSYQ